MALKPARFLDPKTDLPPEFMASPELSQDMMCSRSVRG